MKEILVKQGEEKVVNFNHDSNSNIMVRLVGEGAKVFVNEIFMTEGDVRSDLRIVHEAGNTFSRVNSKGIVKNGVLNTANCVVEIPEKSVDCNTFVNQKFVLLDKLSRAEVFPGLEIKPSRVKAGHASSVAPLNFEEVFYLMSRGFSRKESETLIIEGLLGVDSEKLKSFLSS